MARLSLRLLGPFQAARGGEPVSGFKSDKTRALLAYLAVEADRPHRREALAGLLWPDFPERSARTSLRSALANLRQVIGDQHADPSFLSISRQTIRFNPEADAWIDVTAFTHLLQTRPTTGQLEAAIELYRGSFLEGFSLPDSLPFEEWALLLREGLRRGALGALTQLIVRHEASGDFARALPYAWRQVEFDPLREVAHRQLMRLLALNAQREAALAQYEACRRALGEELGVEPAEETTWLFERIRAGKLKAPASVPRLELRAQPPSFLSQSTTPLDAERPVFVARQQELTRLDEFLATALKGKGCVVFLTGGPGRGKTALMNAFAQRAMDAHPDLIVAGGHCNAYTGFGDPYLPFREILGLLTGDVEALWAARAITTEHARRLWETVPLAVEALLDVGPDLVDTIIPGAPLTRRAGVYAAGPPDQVAWFSELTELVDRKASIPYDPSTPQSALFEQYVGVVATLARERPFLLTVDDLQWVDAGSAGLLCDLGRALVGERILVVGAYRPEEVALGRGEGRHPLGSVVNELQRTFGDITVDLAQAADRRFVDEYVDSVPNRLSEAFRGALFQHTEGHPLFTVELLRAMRDRGDLLRDEEGRWIEGPTLDWEVLPARVEAVIEERVDRLDPELQDILAVASVEGEVFTAQVVAEVQKMEERPMLRRLAGELERRHRLVREQEEVHAGQGRMFRYRFGHVLFQDFVYKRLSRGERRLLHREVAVALEKLYAEQLDEIAVRLAHHFHQAGNYGRACQYNILAAESAARIYANDEAITHYTRAIEVAGTVSVDDISVAKLHRGRGLAYEMLGEFELARADYETTLRIARAADVRQAEQVEWRALLDLGKLWASRDYNQTLEYFERALELARRAGDPAVLADSLNWMGNWHANNENPTKAVAYHQEALTVLAKSGDRRDLANTLDLSGLASMLGGDLDTSVQHYNRAIALFRELDDRARLASSLMGRASTVSSTLAWLVSVPASPPPDATSDIEEALRIAGEIGSAPNEAWAHWSLGLLHTVHGHFGRALQVLQSGLRIATEIGHREYVVGNRCALGNLYIELLAPELAKGQLEETLALAIELRSQIWIHQATGALAEVYLMLDDRKLAQTCLETVISPQTPMDTMGKRYCWARRSELALAQDDPALALDIADRLIASAPGMSPGRVITFLWMLKAEALAVLRRREDALSLLHTALENARATGERCLLWRVHARLRRLYRVMGHQEAAERQLSAARALIDEFAATIPDETLQYNFRQGAGSMLR